jgi:transposase
MGLTCDDRRPTVTVRPQVWVGIDVGKTDHHACAVDETGKVVWTQKLANEQPVIEQLVERALSSAERVRWAIDLTSPMALMLITVLLGAEQSVVYVPGRVVNTMTHAFRGEGNTDAKDARVIAQTARMRNDLTEVNLPDELVIELTQLTGYRADLMTDWVRGVNRLRALLGSIFPALEAAFDYSTRTPLILVAGLCTPNEIRAAGIDAVTAHLVANKAWARGIATTATTAVTLAEQQQLTLPGEAGAASLVKRLARKLLDLDREIKDIDKTITERFREHPYARIIESLPGFGPNLGAEFLVGTGGDLTSFATPGRLAAYAGLIPTPRDSGRITGNLHRPKRYNRRMRRVFYMAALSSIRGNGPSRQFYDRKVRHEALDVRGEVKDLPRLAVAAAGLKLGAA